MSDTTRFQKGKEGNFKIGLGAESKIRILRDSVSNDEKRIDSHSNKKPNRISGMDSNAGAWNVLLANVDKLVNAEEIKKEVRNRWGNLSIGELFFRIYTNTIMVQEAMKMLIEKIVKEYGKNYSSQS